MANTFRIGCIGHLNKKDMYQAIDAVKKTLKELDIKLNSSITDLTPIKLPCRPWATIKIPIPVNNAHEFFIILVIIRCRYSFLKELQRDNEKDYVFFKAKKE